MDQEEKPASNQELSDEEVAQAAGGMAMQHNIPATNRYNELGSQIAKQKARVHYNTGDDALDGASISEKMRESLGLRPQKPVVLPDEVLALVGGGSSPEGGEMRMEFFTCEVCRFCYKLQASDGSAEEALERAKQQHAAAHPECTGTLIYQEGIICA